MDGGSQDAHQGEIEFHYPHVPSKDKRKHGSSDGAESTKYNEIQKMAKAAAEKAQNIPIEIKSPKKTKISQ